MGTVAGVNTRRYHGLLIASLHPPADRYSVFPRVEETVEIDGESFALGAVQYPGAVTPAGFSLLKGFRHTPYATWSYACGSVMVEKSVRLISGEQTVQLSYLASAPCVLHVRLFISFRDYHGLTHRNSTLNGDINESPGSLSIQPYPNLPPLTFHFDSAVFEKSGIWFNNHEYLRELERGLDFTEDLYSPGVLHFRLSPGVPCHLFATIENTRPQLDTAAVPEPPPLTRALDQFRVTRADSRPTLIAGYPWFTDWSRDALIALPALIPAGFAPSETRAILEFLLAERKQGIIPNRFADSASSPEYNTVDASLLFFVAAAAYLNATADSDFLRSTLLPAAIDIIGWHKRGTFNGICVDESDHLLTAGQPGTQLTWMDAKISDYVVTPRIGKPVEINALWFNALQIAAQWAAECGKLQEADRFRDEAQKVKLSFTQKFWNPSRQCLYDVISHDAPDASLRPNQLFAISLPYPLFDRVHAQSIVKIVRELLLTPAGLRTLEPADPRYRARFDGNMASRDSAYHQGTVWPWLIGPYVNAYLYAFDHSGEAKEHCRSVVNSILNLMNGYCMGSIGEVYDGDSPHTPGGCPAQLWSVAQAILAQQHIAKA